MRIYLTDTIMCKHAWIIYQSLLYKINRTRPKTINYSQNSVEPINNVRTEHAENM